MDFSNMFSLRYVSKNVPKIAVMFRHDAEEAKKTVKLLCLKDKKYTEPEARIIYFLIAFSLECYLKSALILEKNLTLEEIKTKYKHNLKTLYEKISFLKLDKYAKELIRDLNNKYKNKIILYTATLVEENNSDHSKFLPVDDYLELLSQIEEKVLKEEELKSLSTKRNK